MADYDWVAGIENEIGGLEDQIGYLEDGIKKLGDAEVSGTDDYTVGAPPSRKKVRDTRSLGRRVETLEDLTAKLKEAAKERKKKLKDQAIKTAIAYGGGDMYNGGQALVGAAGTFNVVCSGASNPQQYRQVRISSQQAMLISNVQICNQSVADPSSGIFSVGPDNTLVIGFPAKSFNTPTPVTFTVVTSAVNQAINIIGTTEPYPHGLRIANLSS